MPNWCANEVRIEGPVDKIYDMAMAMEREELLEHLVPVEGDNFERTSSWGTKWDISDVHMEHNVEDGVIEASFMTAWGPPDMAFVTYLGKNDDVTIENYFYEPGMAFAGVDSESVELPETPDADEWEDDVLLQQLDTMFGIRDCMWESETLEIEENAE
tara:strand:- start:58 stop:531 length:474 start_codon:yes stop_codon:yes gene_type:complete